MSANELLDRFRGWLAIVVIILGMIGTLIGTTWAWRGIIEDFKSSTDEKIRGIEERAMNQMGTLKAAVEQAQDDVKDDRYTLTAASEKALRTKIANPSMNVVDPRDPNTFIEGPKNSGWQP